MNLIQYLTPTNLADEKSKFFNSKNYHPQFKYRWDESDSIDWTKQHLEFQPLIQALKKQNTSQIFQITSQLFDTRLTPSLLCLAKKILTTPPCKITTPPFKKIIENFKSALKFLDLQEYSLKITNQHGFNFRPSGQEKKITVSRYLNLDFFSIDGEIKHELTHIIRYENGKYNQIAPSLKYLPTEEGLAAYYQAYTGKNGQSSLFQEAAEFAMTEISLKKSLRETILFLQNIGFSPELAWQRAIRHKFGFIDSSQPGDIMKPSMYFYHQQLVKNLTAEERYRLFCGKISLKELKDYPQYQGKIPLIKLKAFYSTKK